MWEYDALILVLSKVIEKIWTVFFFTKFSIICILYKCYISIYKNYTEKIIIFTDMTKVFDYVNQEIFKINKLHTYGIRENALNLLWSSCWSYAIYRKFKCVLEYQTRIKSHKNYTDLLTKISNKESHKEAFSVHLYF